MPMILPIKADRGFVEHLRCGWIDSTTWRVVAAYSVAYWLLAGAPGAPTGVTSKLVSLAELADRLEAEVKRGQSAETIVKGSTFDAFFTAGSAFVKAFEETCPEPPSSGDPAGASSSLPSQIGFTPVAPPGT